MSTLRLWLARLAGLFGRGRPDAALANEIAHHLDLETRKNIELGMTPVEARRQARIAFGSIEATREALRDGRSIRWLEELRSDLRFSLRALRANPTLTVAAVLTLALGIGVNGAIFSVVNAVVLRPPPFAAPDRLMVIGEDNADFHWHQADAAPANYLDWREQATAFDGMAAFADGSFPETITGEGAPQLLTASSVTGNFFAVLGVRPVAGRFFDDRETWANGTPVAVISQRLWSTQFHADPHVVGRTITLDGQRVQVVGVAPAALDLPSGRIDIWRPVGWNPASRARTSFRRAHWIRVIARIRPGVSLAAADADLQRVVKRLQRDYPATNRIMGATMSPLQSFLDRDIRTPLLVLTAAVMLLLLIACANVGNLLLAHAEGRRSEVAVRLALGAGRGRVVRQALVHSMLVAGIGGGIGVAVAWAGTRILLAIRPENLLPAASIGMDGGVVAYLALVTGACGLAFGIAPAVWMSRRAPGEVLKEGGRSKTGGRSARFSGNIIVVAEIALAAMLTVGAGLLVRSLTQLNQVNPGFDPTNVLAVSLNVSQAKYDSAAKQVRFYDELESRVAVLPGVVTVGAVSSPPLTGVGWTSEFAIAGHPANSAGGDIAHREITAGYLATMHVPLLGGRGIAVTDAADAPDVVLINDVMARQYFPGEDPIGQRITFNRVPDSTSIWRTIVGVVASEHQAGLELEPRPEVLAPLPQEPQSAMTLMVRTADDPLAAAPMIRRTVASLDPDLAIVSMKAMTQVRSAAMARQRFLMTLLLLFAVTGLLLAAVGVYGVMAHLVRGRRREMGIRVAIGASVAGVRWLVVGAGMRLALAGIAIGLGGALLTTRLMASLLYGVHATDPVTFAVMPIVLLGAALVASWFPASRAARVDPAETLRGQ